MSAEWFALLAFFNIIIKRVYAKRPQSGVSGLRALFLVSLQSSGLCLYGSDVDELASVLAFGEENGAVHESVEGVVLADAYVEAGVVDCAALTLEDVACLGELTTKNLNAESFAL